MNVQQIGSRGSMLTFDDGISLYLIHCSRFNLLCDTHLGPFSMNEVSSFLSDKSGSDRTIVFNSHSDWDHIWGNCSFPDSFIIGHELCRERMLERGEYDLSQNASLRRGSVILKPPNLTFSNRLCFEEEDLEFIYAPGHTIDSAVCYDRQDMVLYLGDLVEDPIPYLDARDLDTYLMTLRSLLIHPAQVLVSAHSGIVTKDLIEHNIKYITGVRDEVPMDPEEFGEYRDVHHWNLNMRIIFKNDTKIRDFMGDDYSYVALLEQLGDLHSLNNEDLMAVLNRFIHFWEGNRVGPVI